MAEISAVKETKAQRAERLKREKNPWDAIRRDSRLCPHGRSSIPENGSTYFRWWGIYTQGDGAGVTGGKGGEGKATDYFMMRVGIPNGILRAASGSRASRKSRAATARNLADITVRQNIQFHWLTIESLPEIMEALDCRRALAQGRLRRRGPQRHRLPAGRHRCTTKSSTLRRWLSKSRTLLQANHEFYNLPRKFKISVTGCPVWCTYPEINDIGLTAMRRGRRSRLLASASAAGCPTNRISRVRLDAFVLPDQAVAVVRAITEIFRDQQGLRESRDRARLKYLFMKEGWTAERFLDEIQNRIGLQTGSRRRGKRSQRHSPRPRRHSSAEAVGPELRRRQRAARTPHRRSARWPPRNWPSASAAATFASP